ncbi:MAG: phytoene/squalene synthase family protein [Candidatus Thorarchaeota archaeon]
MFRGERYHLEVIPTQIRVKDNLTTGELNRAYDYCMKLFANHAKSFHFASRYLEPEQRRSLAALYGFCRLADDFVDEVTLEPDQIETEIDELVEIVSRINSGETFDHPVFQAFGHTQMKYRIPVKYLYELLEGVRMDAHRKEIETQEELDQYCFRVASTVGLSMCYIWRSIHPETLQRAADLGIAMQQTNILRDLAEDYDKGRIYIPLETRQKFRIRREDFEARKITPNFKQLLKHEIAIARANYASAEVGLRDLPPAAAFTIKVAARIYSNILNAIEKMDYQVFRKRAYVPKWKKFWIALRCRQEYVRELKELVIHP